MKTYFNNNNKCIKQWRKKKMEASENTAGGYMVQDHCHDKNKLLS